MLLWSVNKANGSFAGATGTQSVTVKQTVLKILLAALAALFGFLGWAYWYYRPTVEYAYTDIKLTNTPAIFVAAIGLLVLGFIAWMVFEK